MFIKSSDRNVILTDWAVMIVATDQNDVFLGHVESFSVMCSVSEIVLTLSM